MGIFGNLFKSATDKLKDAAERGNADAQVELSEMYYDGKIGGFPNYELFVKWSIKAAEQGNDNAMNNLGWAYHKGLGVEPDQFTAREWFEKAIEQGNIYAMSNLGQAYLHNNYAPGIPHDYNKAVELLQIPAAEGIVEAQYNLGMAYINGIAVGCTEHNLKLAQELIEASSKGGFYRAHNLLLECNGDVRNLNM